MLVLSRKLNEEIVIGENIRITVVEVCGNRIRLGITAPKDVRVRRDEVPLRELASLKPREPVGRLEAVGCH
jgi:carbon storage regulator CsrA